MQLKERLPLNPTDSVRILWNPDFIRVLVAGGPHVWLGLFVGEQFKGGDRVTKKVELPANWHKLVEKYKNIVPTYVRY